MTINRGKFTDYAALPRTAAFAKYDHCSPTGVMIGRYLDQNYGTSELGCFSSERRDNRAGTSISTHSFGAADDRSFRAVGAGNAIEKRRIMLVAIADLLSKSEEYGIQAIHDYMGCRIWRSNRDPHTYPDGWKIQPVDAYGMGQSWADWIHTEVHDVDGAWFDTTPLDQRIGVVPPPVVIRPIIGMSSRGPLVKAVQSFLIDKANQGTVVGNPDGIWGPRTQLAWTNFVIWTNAVHPGAMTTDGNVDGVDWNVIAWNDGGWQRLYSAGFPAGV